MGESTGEAGIPECPGCRKLKAEVESLKREIAELKAIIEELRRGQKRQAAPFSKGPPKEDPKKPGRKPGDQYGAYSCRPAPTPREVGDDEHYRAKLPRQSPCCGARVKKERARRARQRQYQDELV